jgi:hypothetical protein
MYELPVTNCFTEHYRMIRKILICTAAAALGTAVACSNSSQSPASPSSTAAASTTAAADGSTLKVPAPNTSSPTGGTQVSDPVTLTASTVSGKFGSVSPQYRFQVRSGSTVVTEGIVGPASGSSVSFQPSGLNPDSDYTWRVQATMNGANGPWSGDASFKSPVGAYLHPGELRDPLTIGRTIGQPVGNVTFSADGATINDQTSFIAYNIGSPVTDGEFSMMATNIKSSAPGGKSKMMAIQQGFDEPTTNPYRFTIEKRGSGYPEPGATTCRIITGNSDPAAGRIFDCPRATVNFDTTHWYLWTARWRTGNVTITVVDTTTGKTVFNTGVGTGSRAYAPNPMVAYVGAPVGRAGPDDASVPRITVKNVWLSANPRPAFPQ